MCSATSSKSISALEALTPPTKMSAKLAVAGISKPQMVGLPGGKTYKITLASNLSDKTLALQLSDKLCRPTGAVFRAGLDNLLLGLNTLTNKITNISNTLDKSKCLPAAAGLLGGSAATLLLHPLDLLKTRQAVFGESGSKYARLGEAVRSVVREEGGLRGLYSGVRANVLLAGTSWGLYFMTYGAVKSHMLNGNGEEGAVNTLSSGQQLAATFAAGFSTTAVVNPLSVVRTRMVVGNDSKTGSKKGIFGTLGGIIRNEGFKALYKGLIPSLVGVSHGAIQFLAYEKIKGMIATDRKPTTIETLAACSASKVFAAVLTYPCQNLRACQQASVGSNQAPVTLRSMVRAQGPRALYRGLAPYLLHVVPNVCIVFMVYETVSNL